MRTRLIIAAVWTCYPCVLAAEAEPEPKSCTTAKQHLALAEAALGHDELVAADREYRSVIGDGSLCLAALEVSRNDLASAVHVLNDNVENAADPVEILVQTSVVYLQKEDPQLALRAAQDASARDPSNLRAKRVLAQCYLVLGQIENALTQLSELSRLAPDDLEVTYAMASACLRLKRPDEAATLFEAVRRARPGAAARVLIGRTYRDFAYYDQAEKEFRAALAIDPSVRRAHYYLGMTYLNRADPDLLSEAAHEFKQELKLSANDYPSNLNLGMILVRIGRDAEAVAPLTHARQEQPKNPDPLLYLGQAHVHLGNDAAAFNELEQSIRLTADPARNNYQVANAHYLLGRLLFKSGKVAESRTHLARSQVLKAQALRQSGQNRERQAGSPSDSEPKPMALLSEPPKEPARSADGLRSEIRTLLARAYFNLGVMQARQNSFRTAGDLFEHANEWQADFPGLQFTLGLARYNAEQYAEAIPPLERAVNMQQQADEARRLLALSYFSSGRYDRAASLFKADHSLVADANTQYAFGLSLFRSGKVEQGTQVFSALLRQNPGSPEIYLLVGRAYAGVKDHKNALDAFQHALALDASFPGVHSSIGSVLLLSGKLTEAEAEFREELRLHADDLKARYLLAFVLDLRQETDEAVKLLREILRAQPDYADAHQTLGKILVKKQDLQGALEHIEAAVRLAPNDPAKYYQLGEVYRRLGRMDEAQQAFTRFQQLKKPEGQ